jgi:hypothetical protein
MCSNMLVVVQRQSRIDATFLTMTNIIELILKMLQGGTLQSLASSLGLGENQTKGALTAVVPAILGLFMKKAQEPGGAQSLLDTITKTAPGGATRAPGGIDLANLASAFTGQGQQNVQNAGTQILEQVLGGSSNVQSVVSALASHVGIDQTKTSQLVSLATPIVAAVLHKQAGQQGGGANGLASVLAGQGDFLKGMLPSGLGNALGMSGLLGGLGQMAGGIGDRGREAAAGAAAAATSAGGAAQRSGGTFLTRILPLLILLGLVWWLWRSCSTGTVQPGANPPAPAATASPTVSTETKKETPGTGTPAAETPAAETPAAAAASPEATASPEVTASPEATAKATPAP